MNYFNRHTKNKNITLENLNLDNLSNNEINFIQTLDFNDYLNKLTEYFEENYDEFEVVELTEDNGFIYLGSSDLDGGKDIPYIHTDYSYNLKEIEAFNHIGLFSVIKYERVNKNNGSIVVYINSDQVTIGLSRS